MRVLVIVTIVSAVITTVGGLVMWRTLGRQVFLLGLSILLLTCSVIVEGDLLRYAMLAVGGVLTIVNLFPVDRAGLRAMQPVPWLALGAAVAIAASWLVGGDSSSQLQRWMLVVIVVLSALAVGFSLVRGAQALRSNRASG
jgi:hypothetical protein